MTLSETADSVYFVAPEFQSLQNLTEEEYLNLMIGPQTMRLDYLIPVTVFYAAIFTTGLIGNILTCIVIVKNNEMHTLTNYYLFNLTISDLIYLTAGIPTEMTVLWWLYPWPYSVGICKLIGFLSDTSTYASVLTIVAFSLERYMAICHPLRIYALSTTKRSIRSILAIWLIAMISAIPTPIYTNVHYFDYPPGSGIISKKSAICFPDVPPFPQYAISCFIFFLLPMFILVFVYARMGLKIRNSMKQTKTSGVTESSAHLECQQVKGRRTVVRMLNAVGVIFFICWAPNQVQRMVYTYTDWNIKNKELSDCIYLLSGCLFYVSPTVNPILYNSMSVRYRKAFKETICPCGTKKPILLPVTIQDQTASSSRS